MVAMNAYGGLGPMVNAVLWVEVVIGIFFVALRLYTRQAILNNIGWDDYLTVAALVSLPHEDEACLPNPAMRLGLGLTLPTGCPHHLHRFYPRRNGIRARKTLCGSRRSAHIFRSG